MASDTKEDLIRVEVAYATPERQMLLELEVHTGCTVAEAIELSGIRQEFPDMVVDPDALGIFSRKVAAGQRLAEGDRVEIYRPLIADPKESRRKRAEAGKSAKKK